MADSDLITRRCLSVIIPTLNAAAHLPLTLAALDDGVASGLVTQILVVDGGSTDDTVACARAGGAGVLDGPRGRGVQLSLGGEAARGAWLLFLHADTVLASGWPQVVRDFIVASSSGPPGGRAGYFRFALDDGAPDARRLERRVAWRCRVLALPYGDQGLLMPAALYRRVGGYRPFPLMEDVEMVRRLGRARLAEIPAEAVTSAERYRSEGYRRRSARNLACLALYFLGVPPRLIQRFYG